MGCVACNYNPNNLPHTCERYKPVSETFKAGDLVTGSNYRLNERTHEIIAVYDDLAWVVPVDQPDGRATFEVRLSLLTRYVPKWEKNARYANNSEEEFEVVWVYPNGGAAIVWDSNPNSIDQRYGRDVGMYRKVS